MIIYNRAGDIYNVENFESLRLFADEKISDKCYIVMSRIAGSERMMLTIGEYDSEEDARYDMDMIAVSFAQHMEVADIRPEDESD